MVVRGVVVVVVRCRVVVVDVVEASVAPAMAAPPSLASRVLVPVVMSGFVVPVVFIMPMEPDVPIVPVVPVVLDIVASLTPPSQVPVVDVVPMPEFVVSVPVIEPLPIVEPPPVEPVPLIVVSDDIELPPDDVCVAVDALLVSGFSWEHALATPNAPTTAARRRLLLNRFMDVSVEKQAL